MPISEVVAFIKTALLVKLERLDNSEMGCFLRRSYNANFIYVSNIGVHVVKFNGTEKSYRTHKLHIDVDEHPEEFKDLILFIVNTVEATLL